MAKKKRWQSEEAPQEDVSSSEEAPQEDVSSSEEDVLMKAIEQHESEMMEPAKPEALPKDPNPPRNIVPFRVFAQVSGSKWDQLAGFKSHVKRMKLGPRSVVEWHQIYAEFKNRPVR